MKGTTDQKQVRSERGSACDCHGHHGEEKHCGCHGHHDEEKHCGCHGHHDEEKHCGCHGHHDEHEGGCCCCEEGIERLGKREIFLYIIGALVMAVAFLPPIPAIVRWICAAAVYLTFGVTVWKEMVEGFCQKKIFTEFTLMCTASIGAVILGEYADAAAVMYLYSLGETISGLASGKARRNIAGLIEVVPEQVTVLKHGEPRVCRSEDVEIGQVILIRSGERIPLDGTVLRGEGMADTSSITGEQLPVELTEHSECLSGSLLISGSVEVEVTRNYDHSVANRMKEAVEEASRRKAVTEKKIARVASVITPAAFVIALLIFAIGAILTGNVSEWFRRGLTILVCSCPCSLILSIPLTYFAGIGFAARRGVVLRGGEVIDNLAHMETLLLDKTGTLTEIALRYDGLVLPQNGTLAEEQVHALAYPTLMHSPHVAAQTYCEALRGMRSDRELSGVENLPGRGIRAYIEGRKVLCGNARLLAEEGITVPSVTETAIYLAWDGSYLGALTFSSHVKSGAKESIAELQRLGVTRTAILSGDTVTAVREVAEAVGITEIYAERMPAEKLELLERIYREQKKKSRGTVAFCGDGLNDSAAIAASDIGIAMGSGGSAVTVEAADAILMYDSLARLPEAVRSARKTVRIANQNIVISLGMKIVVALLCVLVLPSMELALVADVGAAVITVLNAMRAGNR
ncbi:MAG: cadmium-translocating P-type ATPase [Clostridia bacterium]|nr:cadmium-translocating P-type ATPase [Clostridia bacterium]